MLQSLSLLVVLSLCPFTSSQNMYHFIKESKSWSDAQSYCKQNYTDLATVHNMEDVRRLRAAANGSTDAWIGLYQTSDKKENRTWHWSQPGLEYNQSQTNWFSGEPNDGASYSIELENCVVIDNSSQWFDFPCDKEPSDQYHHCFICYNGSSKSYKLNTTRQTWLEALQSCRDDHMDLISGLDQLNQLKTSELVNTLCNNNFWWIGLFRDTWGWSDGSSSSFRHWDKSDDVLKGNSDSSPKKCAKLGNQDKWSSENCAEAKPFICYDDHYILVKERLSWEEALIYCRQQHRDLAWITDEHQKRMVQERVKMADTDYVWLGLYYTCVLEEWVWVNGHYVWNENWKQNEPNVCGVSGAMEKTGDNKWVKKPSGETFNFVCAVYC